MKEGDIISIKIKRDEDGPEIKETDLDIGIHKFGDEKVKKELITGHLKVQKGETFSVPGMTLPVPEPKIIANTKTMIARTYETIQSFLDHVTKNSTLWTKPPEPDMIALSNGFNAFKSQIQWDRMSHGCKAFMKIENVQSQSKRVKDTIALMIYLTIAGLLQERIAIKPYTTLGDDTAGNVRRVEKIGTEDLGAYTDFNELHPYAKKFDHGKHSPFFSYFRLTCDFTKRNFNVNSSDHRKLVIHISTKFIKENPAKHAVFTMIHEASHKFAAAKDVCYFAMGFDDGKWKKIKGFFDCGGDEAYKIPLAWCEFITLEMEKCTDKGCKEDPNRAYTYNADSIAALIYHYGNGGTDKKS